ncbi:hypothetical protein GCM10010218_53780 [Streptomyces mashuensis]|uniref:Thiaminase-2/PQQC domain-containing protein n=1 Tax=Streptomyces mashuensis TaxID=33904 RepID=A0A919EFI2_9ACTN|nr:TenA family transcriptional regulator [Streptomyces mashuensis]GHF65530.1 hypothetical protein GCM10010218_53780 [Streptomyces mashuensis]
MFSDGLGAAARPVLRAVLDHPFWAGLRDGTLPPAALTRFVEQDTGHLLPCYGRAFAQCAAVCADEAGAALLARCAAETAASAPRLRAALAGLAPELGVPPPAEDVAALPAVRDQCAGVTAAAASSYAAGLGVVLPFMVVHLEVCRDLGARGLPGARYAPWLDAYRPGGGVEHAVRAVCALADAFGAAASSAARTEAATWYGRGARYELAFVEACLTA